MDTGKTGRYLGCYSHELVIVGPCGHFRDESAASVPQRRVHSLKKAHSELGEGPHPNFRIAEYPSS